MTDSPSGVGARAPIEPLEQLIARWRSEATNADHAAVMMEAQGRVSDARCCRVRASYQRACADDLALVWHALSGRIDGVVRAMLEKAEVPYMVPSHSVLGWADSLEALLRSERSRSGPAQKDAPEPETEKCKS